MSDRLPLNDGAQNATRTPATKLYRHALESIFKFCALKELHAILSVNREWSAAVGSMRSIRASHLANSVTHLSRIAGSRLSRHITWLSGGVTYALDGLRILAEQMPWIENARFSVPAQGRVECAEEAAALFSRRTRINTFHVMWPSRRDGVALTIESMDQCAIAANHLINAAGCMQQLEEFDLSLMCHDERISFAPLTALTSLRTLSISASNLRPTRPSNLPSDEQVAALRRMHSLERFVHDFSDPNGILRLLLRPPIPPPRWTSARVTSGAADLLPLLQSLPDLTSLDVDCRRGDVEFLLSLPRVLSLTLMQFSALAVGPANPTRMITTLQHCPQLTSLRCYGPIFSSAQLASLFAALPQLSDLALSRLPDLISLSFFATEALAASLKSVHIRDCWKVPPDEIVHLLGLRSLQSLYVWDLREPLSDAQKAQLRSAHPRAQMSL